MKKILKKWMNKTAVSEIIGTLMLLAIAVILFSSLIVYVLSMDDDPAAPSLNLVGRVAASGENAIIEHNGGDSMQLKNTKVILQMGDVKTEMITFDDNGNAYNESGAPLGILIRGGSNGDTDEWWEIGEYFSYNGFNANLQYWRVHAIVIDTVSNSIVMSGTINTGINDYIFTDKDDVTGAADFYYEPGAPYAGDTVQFFDNSSYDNYIIHWDWEFGDGNNTGTTNPTVINQYTNPGTYTVNMTITYPASIFENEVTDVTVPAESQDIIVSLVPVPDDQPPIINDHSPGYAMPNEPFTFNASVVDDIGVHSVFVTYWIDDIYKGNITMSYAGGTYYNRTIDIPATGSWLNYTFSANDTANNWADPKGGNIPIIDSMSGLVILYNDTGIIDIFYGDKAIADAADAANPNDSILIYPKDGGYRTTGKGAYDIEQDNIKMEGASHDGVVINCGLDGINLKGVSNVIVRNITLVAIQESPYGTAFDAGIDISGGSTNITVEDLTIIGASHAAIKVDSSSQVHIRNCTLFENQNNGIWSYYSTDITITGCNINDTGKYKGTGNGISLEVTSRCLIRGNKLYDNDKGIILISTQTTSTEENTMEFNEIYGNRVGVRFEDASDNNMEYNKIYDNTGVGINLTVDATDNLIFHNNLQNNIGNNAWDEGNNNWNNSNEGNYWDDYTGSDTKEPHDIGDTPYIIPPGSNQDEYPLMDPITWP